MVRVLCLIPVVVIATSIATAVPAPKRIPKTTGIIILDDCDEQYKGKKSYVDNLTFFDTTGTLKFRQSGFNNCQSIGSSRMIAVDSARECIWVIENVGRRIRRLDFAGKENLTIPEVHGSALAVDPETGNVWALIGDGSIGKGKVAVYDSTGKDVASYDVSGWDIAYDRKSKAFWIVEKNLTKVNAADGQILCSVEVATWCASSVDVDSRSGSVWVAVRKHSEVAGSSNRLVKVDTNGKELTAVDLGLKVPFRVSVDPINGSVWMAHFRKSVERFSADGKSQGEFAVEALAVQVDQAGGDVWVVTPTEVQKMTPKGEITTRAKHAGTTSQAWITVVE